MTGLQIGYSGSPGQSSSYQGPAQNEYFSRPSMPNSSSFGSSGITGPPVAFPPSILPKTTPPPISYNKPDPFTSPPASLRDSNAQQPLSPNASLSNSFHRPPINYPHLAPTSQPNQPSSGTDLQRPPLAAQPNSFGRSPYPDQPHHRRLSHNNYKPVNLNELPQWLDGRVGMTGLKNLGNSESTQQSRPF